MFALSWDQTGQRFYENGVDHGVLYPTVLTNNQGFGKGVAWNGLTSVDESPSGGEPNALYADNIKYLNLISAEEFGATINAYTYPDEFAECDGSKEITKGVSIGQQARKLFGFSYRTKLGNDLDPDLGYKLHLVYNCLAAPSSKTFETVNDSPDAITFAWEISTTPVEVEGAKPTAVLTIDSVKIDPAKLTQLENILYGTAATSDPDTAAVDPRLPFPNEIATLLA